MGTTPSTPDPLAREKVPEIHSFKFIYYDF